MGIIAIVISMILYLIVFMDNFMKKDYPHAMMWFFYAMANISLIWYELVKKQLNTSSNNNSIGFIAIIISMILYLIVSQDNFKQKDYPHAMMWFFYAMANVGLIWYELVKKGWID